jgi:hypothetical protein
MEVWFGRVILTAVILLTETVLVPLRRMIVGDKQPLSVLADKKRFLSARAVLR